MSAVWARLRGGELTPGRAAASVAVGLAVGTTPLYGAHFWIVLAICVPLRLDAALAYLAANISIPPIAPFLLVAEIEIGSFVRTGHAVAVKAFEARARGFGELAKELAIGTAIFSPAVGALGGAIAWAIASRARKGRQKRRGESAIDASIRRVAARYAGGRLAAQGYVRGKLASDPVARSILGLGPLGEVVDVGCGRGQLAVLLVEAGCATSVRGMDWDAAKVADGTRAAAGLPVALDVADLRVAEVPPCDTVLLVDVLHYLTGAEQDTVLARAAGAARTRVVIRELDPDRGWRSALTRVQEGITTALGYNRGARVHVRPVGAMASVLRGAGFEVSVEPCWGATPFANVLVVGTRVGNQSGVP